MLHQIKDLWAVFSINSETVALGRLKAALPTMRGPQKSALCEEAAEAVV